MEDLEIPVEIGTQGNVLIPDGYVALETGELREYGDLLTSRNGEPEGKVWLGAALAGTTVSANSPYITIRRLVESPKNYGGW